MIIESKTNANFKRYLSLLESQGIKEYREFLIFGQKAVRETLRNFPDAVSELITFAKAEALNTKVKTTELSKSLFNEIDIYKTGFPLLVCKTWEIPTIDLSQQPSGFEILSPIGDPRNLGGLLRSSFALGASKVILLKESSNPFLPPCTRAASGSLFNIKLFRGPSLKDLSEFLGHPNYLALDMNGTEISKFKWPLDLRLVIGEEGPGLKGLEFANKITINQQVGADSLNVTMATTIALFSYRTHHPIKNV
jgi:RNA methyltransferase, TrmH family